jgi:tetratricopeptide (TPR) repeat protein
VTALHSSSFDSAMRDGHDALQAEHNLQAALIFEQAADLTVDRDEVSSAHQMRGVALRKTGRLDQAETAFSDALNTAESGLQQAKVLRDLGMNQLDAAMLIENQEDQEFAFDDCETTIKRSLKLFFSEDHPVEFAATLGFLGRVALRRGDRKRATDLLRQASLALSDAPVYQFNNLIWLMLASPVDRWLRFPQAVWLVLRYRPNRTLGAFARVLPALGGPKLYDAMRKSKSNR